MGASCWGRDSWDATMLLLSLGIGHPNDGSEKVWPTLIEHQLIFRRVG